MASYGVEAVNEPMEVAASQLSLYSLRDHKSAPYSSNFLGMRCICHNVFGLTTNSLWKIDDVSLLLPVNGRYYLPYNDYSKVLL